MAIPKKIHYCWLSGEPFPSQIRECIDSWHKFMPDYEFKLWDMNTFDIDSVPYVRQAVDKRKWAFASDYIRLWALYSEGGIYLDSDIMVLRSFDDLLECKSFTGFESGGRIAAWIFASESGNPLFKELLDYYDGRNFVDDNGIPDLTPNTVPTTKILVKYGLKAKNTVQQLDDITVFSEDYFCPMNPWTERVVATDNTHAKHLFLGGWMNDKNDEAFMKEVEERTRALADNVLSQNKESKVYIYGAGIVGHIVLEYLKREYPDFSIEGFIVTTNEYGWEYVEDTPLYGVLDGNIDRNIPVIIATIPKVKGDIKNVLAIQGYSKVLEL